MAGEGPDSTKSNPGDRSLGDPTKEGTVTGAIDGRGQARLSDFGLAISAEDGAGAGVSGTPVYMAPEQLAGAAATAWSDLYAFGLVLYEVLAGKRPFEAGSLEELRARHAAGTPPSLRSSVPEVDPRVERLVLQRLEEDPSARPPSVAAFVTSLGGKPLLGRPLLPD